MKEQNDVQAFEQLSDAAQTVLVEALIPNAHDGVVDLSQRAIANMLDMASKTIVKAKRELVQGRFIVPQGDIVQRQRICYKLTKRAALAERKRVTSGSRHAPYIRRSDATRPRVALLVHDGDEIAHFAEGCLIVSKRLPRIAEIMEWHSRQKLIEDGFFALGKRMLQSGWSRIDERAKFVVNRGFAQQDNVSEIGESSPEIRGLFAAGLFAQGCRPTRLRARWRPAAERLWSTVLILL